MKMAHLSWTPPNMSSIGEVCDSLGAVWLSLYDGNHWATGRLRVNSTFVKGGIISDSLFAGNIANDTYGWLWCGSHWQMSGPHSFPSMWWRHARESLVVELWGGFHCAVVGAGLGGREVCFYRCSTVVLFPGCVLISPSIIRATTLL